MKPRKSKLKIRNIHEGNPVRIVDDGALAARDVNDGRVNPVLILDTSDRPDIEEFIRAHESASNLGDFTMQWGQLEGHEGTVALFLTFIRPVEAVIILEFDITEEGIIVDQALLGRGLYLQAGREGDRFIDDVHRPKVMLNFGESDFQETWNKLWRKHVQKYLRTQGLTKSAARRATEEIIKETRKLRDMMRLHGTAGTS